MMARGHNVAMFLALSLLANAFCLPPNAMFRMRKSISDNEVNSKTSLIPDDIAKVAMDGDKENTDSDDSKVVTTSEDDEDDDDDFDDSKSQPASGGSNIFSLINIATALLPSLSGNNNVKKNNDYVKKVIKDAIIKYQAQGIQKRQDVGDNVIEIDYATELKPPVFERQESDESDDSEASASNSEDSDEDNGAEESVEEASKEKGGSKSKQDSASNASNGNDNSDSNASNSDYDEPEGDGQGGGILGLLAGLSGDGESDLGSLLAAVGGIVANLSGDGIDLNAVISTALGLFVGLLSDDNTNPGEVLSSYLLTSLDTITGGGAQNNGAFFGKFLSSLVKGASAAENSNSASDEDGGMKMADSAGFVLSLLMGLLGDMSKHSSGSSSWR